MEFLYCIEHEKIVDVQTNTFNQFVFHAFIGNVNDYPDWNVCDGPFASCPPPEMTEDYWSFIFEMEPIESEIKEWNLN